MTHYMSFDVSLIKSSKKNFDQIDNEENSEESTWDKVVRYIFGGSALIWGGVFVYTLIVIIKGLNG